MTARNGRPGGRVKAGEALAAGPASPPFREFFSAPEFLPENREKGHCTQMDLFQVIETKTEISEIAPKSAISEPFISVAARQQTCAICSAVFDLPPRSKATACSEECRRRRQQAYGAAYRQQGREMKAKMLAMFGGRRPTEAEFLKLLQQRKGKS